MSQTRFPTDMALSYKARRRLALLILLVAMPLYVVAVVTVLNLLGRPPFLVELLVYVVLGLLWALPFRFVFRGIGKPDPDQTDSGPQSEKKAAVQRDPDVGN